MVAYRKIDEASPPTGRKVALSHELFHGLTPDEFRAERETFNDAVGMAPGVRRRLEAQLKERLMTPPDAPTWGPDWVKHGEKFAPRRGEKRALLGGLFKKKRRRRRDRDTTTSPSRPTRITSSPATWRRAARSRITARSISAQASSRW